MLAVGESVPDALVWTTPQESATVAHIAADGGPILLLFYLFDWSST